MSRLTLTDARVRVLKPRKYTYPVRDAKLKGFGVRVLPSGAKRFFLHTQYRGQRSWNLVGDTSAMAVAEARMRAGSMLATLRGDAPVDAPSFEAVAEAVFRRYVHLADRDVEAAAERIGTEMARVVALEQRFPSCRLRHGKPAGSSVCVGHPTVVSPPRRARGLARWQQFLYSPLRSTHRPFRPRVSRPDPALLFLRLPRCSQDT